MLSIVQFWPIMHCIIEYLPFSPSISTMQSVVFASLMHPINRISMNIGISMNMENTCDFIKVRQCCNNKRRKSYNKIIYWENNYRSYPFKHICAQYFFLNIILLKYFLFYSRSMSMFVSTV